MFQQLAECHIGMCFWRIVVESHKYFALLAAATRQYVVFPVVGGCPFSLRIRNCVPWTCNDAAPCYADGSDIGMAL